MLRGQSTSGSSCGGGRQPPEWSHGHLGRVRIHQREGAADEGTGTVSDRRSAAERQRSMARPLPAPSAISALLRRLIGTTRRPCCFARRQRGAGGLSCEHRPAAVSLFLLRRRRHGVGPGGRPGALWSTGGCREAGGGVGCVEQERGQAVAPPREATVTKKEKDFGRCLFDSAAWMGGIRM